LKNFKASFAIFFSLFKNSLFVSMGLIIVTFWIITIIPIVINSYNDSLEKSLATKQPHITIEYLDDKQIFNQLELQKKESEIRNIVGISNIQAINSYVKSKVFVNLKSYGNNLSEYSGYIEAIGLSKFHYPITYDFSAFEPVMLSDYGFKISPLELFEEFRNHENTIFFNKSLYKSVVPLVTYEAHYDMKFFLDDAKTSHAQGNFLAIVEDFFDRPIIYMDYQYLNKILNLEKNHITGFMINIQDQKKLLHIKEKLNIYFNKTKKTALVATWRELNKKQNDIFKIFTQVGKFLNWIILTLAVAAVTIYLYKSLLIKQPQLRLLNILGLRLVSIVNITIISLTALSVSFASLSVHLLLPYFYSSVLAEDLEVSISFYLFDILLSFAILTLVVTLMVQNLFKQKYNIFK